MINFKGLKHHLVAAVSGLIDEPMDEAKAKLVALMNDTAGDEPKSFQRCVGRIQTQVADLQDTLATAVESVLKTADVMDKDMYDAAGGLAEQLNRSAVAASVASHAAEAVYYLTIDPACGMFTRSCA